MAKALLVVLTINFSMMVHYVVKLQRGRNGLTVLGALVYWGRIFVQIGFEMFVLLSLGSFVVKLYMKSLYPDESDQTKNISDKC